MDNLSTPNTSNQFGVPASPANYIAPGKRPVSSMSPLIIWDTAGKHVRLVLGGSGGPRITTSVAQVAILNWLFGRDIKIAIDSPRLHSQLLPEDVEAESGFDVVSTCLTIKSLSISKKIIRSMIRRRKSDVHFLCHSIAFSFKCSSPSVTLLL